MRFEYFIIASFIHWATAVVYIKAPCPNVKAVANFDLSKFVKGRWFEIARYPNDISRSGDCVVIEFSIPSAPGKFRVTEVIDGGLSYIEGNLNLAPEAGNTGIINMYSRNVTQEETSTLLPVYILDTDYDNYAIGYECKYNETTQTRHDYSWIASRTKTFNENSMKALNNVVESSGVLNKDLFVWEHFNEEACKTHKHHL